MPRGTRNVEVHIEGLEELKRAFASLEMGMRGDVLGDTALVAAEVVKAEAKEICPVDLGTLQGSITTELDEVGPTRAFAAIGYGTVAPYGRYVELGTDRMAAQPFLRPALKTKEADATRVAGEVLWRIIEGHTRGRA